MRQSLEALAWLRAQGVRQVYFKYCSTFDSTDAGNIGPVADALLDALGGGFTIACPALPANKRTVYQGYLFVGDVTLSDSPMRNHPLTPMTDANLVRVLGRQTKRKVGLVPWSDVRRGAAAIRARFDALRAAGTTYAVVDAIEDADLDAIGEACADLALVTAGSGIALGLPANFRRQGLLAERGDAAVLPKVDGKAAVLAGSCSEMTRKQLAVLRAYASRGAARSAHAGHARGAGRARARRRRGRPRRGQAVPRLLERAAGEDRRDPAHARRRAGGGARRARVQRTRRARWSIAACASSSSPAARPRARSCRRSASRRCAIGPTIDPGVPWTVSLGEPRIALALKSGNFGAEDFFAKALGMLR